MLRMDTPALVKGGYTLGLTSIAPMTRSLSSRVTIRSFPRAGDRCACKERIYAWANAHCPRDTQPELQCHYPSLFKGGGPLRLRR